MELAFDLLRSVIYGVIEGITEWLPISSTGHMILAEQILQFNLSADFMEMFRVVIQLGAILAVVVLYFQKLWPFCRDNGRDTGVSKHIRWPVLRLWFKIIVACLPAAVLGILLDDWMDEHLYNSVVVALMLILYGAIFIWMENRNQGMEFPIQKTGELSYRTALLIGAFQCLSLIPGTSRSGATIIGAMLLGCARPVAAEFSFFLGIPVMCGASLLRIVKYLLQEGAFTGEQWIIMLLGMLISFLVAVVTIRYLMSYIRKHDFKIFGYYRIVLGVIVLVFFGIKALAGTP